jgi:FKBP-type peptidyl-prolyl cis-trans isomerase SlyD
MSEITSNAVVTLRYTIADSKGTMIDGGKEPFEYLHGGYGAIFLPVEAALTGRAIGGSVRVDLLPEEAFGEYNPELVHTVPLEALPQPLTVGMQLEGTVSEDSEAGPAYATVTEISDGNAVLDANHPLAGMALIFSCTVQDVRAATAEELAGARKSTRVS